MACRAQVLRPAPRGPLVRVAEQWTRISSPDGRVTSLEQREAWQRDRDRFERLAALRAELRECINPAAESRLLMAVHSLEYALGLTLTRWHLCGDQYGRGAHSRRRGVA